MHDEVLQDLMMTHARPVAQPSSTDVIQELAAHAPVCTGLLTFVAEPYAVKPLNSGLGHV